jgi:hypothetical protein
MKQLFRFSGLLTLIFLATNSCSDNNETEVKSKKINSIYGNWARIGFSNSSVILARTKTLTTEGYGLSLNEDGSYVERKNAGWCGTPPISYLNYPGTWKPINDSTLTVKVGYWGGTTQYKLIINSSKQDTIAIQFVYE